MTLQPSPLARNQPDSLADVLERVLDKGVVIAGDVVVNVLDIELLTLKLRLFIASADTARELGMDWWTRDPFFSSRAEPVDARGQQPVEATARRPDGSGSRPAVTSDQGGSTEAARLARENEQLRAAVAELRAGHRRGGGHPPPDGPTGTGDGR